MKVNACSASVSNEARFLTSPLEPTSKSWNYARQLFSVPTLSPLALKDECRNLSRFSTIDFEALSNGFLYVGETENLEARLLKHNEGTASVFTARRRPVSLAHSEVHQFQAGALARERQLKRWTRAKKEALIARVLLAGRSRSRVRAEGMGTCQ